MEELNVTRVESGYVVCVDAEGKEYRVTIDDVSLSRLRRPTDAESNVRVSPRDIQAHLRSGLSRDEVAALTGLSPSEVERFEGPVLAELEYVITSALSLAAPSTDHSDAPGTTIGARVQHQVERLGGTTPTWSSWRDADGHWQLRCTYTLGDREVSARWSFDSKRQSVTPRDDEASSLLSLEVYSSGVIPRLRAVNHQPRRPEKDETHDSAGDVTAPVDIPGSVPESGARATDVNGASVNRREESEEAPIDDTSLPETEEAVATPTADLLAALRKRRSESANAPAWLAEAAAESPSPSITDEIIELTENPPAKSNRTGSSRRNRASMPTWDEIVFGTKVDDDLT